jgi:hypothetical protein
VSTTTVRNKDIMEMNKKNRNMRQLATLTPEHCRVDGITERQFVDDVRHIETHASEELLQKVGVRVRLTERENKEKACM